MKSKWYLYPALLGMWVLLTPFLTAHAVEYGGIGGRPANPRQDNPRTDSIFVHTINPGGTVDDAIKLINNTAEQKTLLVYAVDGMSATGGAFTCAQQSDPIKNSGGWITLTKSEVTLESLTTQIVPFTITLPPNASVGEHNACLVVQEKKEADTSGKTGVVLSFRTGIRAAILVPGNVVRNLEIVGFGVSKKTGGDYFLQPRVKNTGNVSIDTTITASVKNILGGKQTNFGGQYPILRDEESEWNFEYKRPFWGGWYKATLAVAYDANSAAGVGSESGEALTILNGPEVVFFSMPKPYALAIEALVLLLIFGFVWLLLFARRRRKWIEQTWELYQVSRGEDIMSIAADHDVSWEILAQVNKIKPPYKLQEGAIIKVPPISNEYVE